MLHTVWLVFTPGTYLQGLPFDIQQAGDGRTFYYHLLPHRHVFRPLCLPAQEVAQGLCVTLTLDASVLWANMEASECLEAWKLGSWQDLSQRGTQKGQKEEPRFFVPATANPSQKCGCFETLTLATLASHPSSFDAAVVEVLGSAHDGCLELNAHGGASLQY